ncbi:peptidoglycan-binding protein [Plectonema cf. radiosum LEGE 06105]|uniref:Peptidoglycan-binding protein n=1 Tax=Plectonema cf. radiosum LEGE 06105 TaxID=945769 RepID=A0A8J7F2Y5_9CYAN|nr:peptidoglycan-binding protein [Plectonema radiosum]MBE9211449.1 peptidoglycan-binding protein [Plectonema cf. radiosum LEGE 06105]
MENIGYTYAASAYEAPESFKIVPFRFYNKKQSTFFVMRLLSVALTLFFLSNLGQALALEKRGSRGASVTSIQECLKKLGYFNASATGFYGEITENAVIRFQKDNRITADGVVGSNTQRILQSKCATPKPVTKPLPELSVGSCSNGKCPNLKPGDKNRYVTYLQTRLRDWGYVKFNPNGNYGPQTTEAVKRFQRDNQLFVDGVVGQQTWQRIDSPLIKCDKPTLQRGDQDECVTQLQQTLRELGYFKGYPTDYYGIDTWEAVKQFQRNYELPPNGIVDSLTWKKLEEAVKHRYIVIIPVTSPYTLDEVRRFVPNASISFNQKLGEYIRVGDFQQRNTAQQSAQSFRNNGFNAEILSQDKL